MSEAPSTPSPQSQEFVHCLDLWYNDGSLVIVTESLAFRVHTSIMATNCEIFRDMATIPQSKGSEETQEKWEECPVVRLQDSATDMQHFLKAIYHIS